MGPSQTVSWVQHIPLFGIEKHEEAEAAGTEVESLIYGVRDTTRGLFASIKQNRNKISLYFPLTVFWSLDFLEKSELPSEWEPQWKLSVSETRVNPPSKLGHHLEAGMKSWDGFPTCLMPSQEAQSQGCPEKFIPCWHGGLSSSLPLHIILSQSLSL